MAVTGSAPTASIEPPVGAGFQRLGDIADDTLSAVVWGTEGTGKSLFVLRNFPLPIMVGNLDRPFTRAHLGMLDADRAKAVFVKNLREGLHDIDQLSALQIKGDVERMLDENLDWLKGGTFLLDGGTMYRDVLKLSDPTIGPKIAAGSRFNPKDKAQVNAYLGALISYIQDKGIHFAVTAHAANSWIMENVVDDSGGVKKQLVRTKNMYPKFDDIAFERCNLSTLMFKRCECGRNIVNQDGTCTGAKDPFEADGAKAEKHYGRHHMTRIVANKLNTAVEGREYENLDYATLRLLCFDPRKAALL